MIDLRTSRQRAQRCRNHAIVLAALLFVDACRTPERQAEFEGGGSWTPLAPEVLPRALDAPAGPQTLAQLLERVRRVSPSSEVMAAATDRALAALEEAQSASGLRLDFDLSATYTDNPALAFIGELNAGELEPSSGLGGMGWTPHGQAGLHAGALLWDGGRRRALEAAAALGVDASRAAAEARALATEGSVTRLFLGLSEGRALEVAALGRLSAVDGAIEAARARLEAGSGLASEVESLEARRAALDEALLVVCSKQAEQLASLGILAGAGALEVDLDAPLGDWDQDGAALLTLPELFDQARATRPDLVALSAAVDARRESLFASELASGPTLVAFADAWLDGGTPLGAVDRGSASVGAQLNWSLLDGGLRASHEAGARADLRASRAALAEATQALELELGSARRAVELADLRTVTASRGAASARRALTELDAGYEAGQVSLERWLGAESDAGEAETRVQAARVRATLARANLTLTLGQSLLAPTTLTPEPPSR